VERINERWMIERVTMVDPAHTYNRHDGRLRARRPLCCRHDPRGVHHDRARRGDGPETTPSSTPSSHERSVVQQTGARRVGDRRRRTVVSLRVGSSPGRSLAADAHVGTFFGRRRRHPARAPRFRTCRTSWARRDRTARQRARHDQTSQAANYDGLTKSRGEDRWPTRGSL